MKAITLYGIKNCSTVKKARQWLEERQIAYIFHDYQVHGLKREQLMPWVKELGWQALVNTKGTTWRQLPADKKIELDEAKAIELMLEKTSLIKRPLIDLGKERKLGFTETDYQEWLG